MADVEKALQAFIVARQRDARILEDYCALLETILAHTNMCMACEAGPCAEMKSLMELREKLRAEAHDIRARIQGERKAA